MRIFKPIRYLAIAAIAVTSLALVACGSDDEGGSAPAPPAAQAPAPEPTQAPAPTATSIPEPTTVPEPTTAPQLVTGPDRDELVSGLDLVQVPTELGLTAKKLDKATVAEVWTKFVENTRHVVSNGGVVLDICADGTGRILVDPELQDERFSWSLQKDPGGRWYSAIVTFVFDDPGIVGDFYGLNRMPLDLNSEGDRKWDQRVGSNTVDTYANPGCLS